jgi:chemotaxis protein CheX
VQAQMTEPDLAEIVQGTVEVMLGLDPGDLLPGPEASICELGASVQFTGDWEGAVLVSCDSAWARDAAAAMFASHPDELSTNDIADALGELANMIGGNVKPLLPASASLSLPTVVQGADMRLGIPGARQWLGVTYRRGPSELSVRIFERVAAEPSIS